MKKYFDRNHTIFYKSLFPYKSNNKSLPYLKKESVVIGIGGNIGDTYWSFKKVFNKLKRHSRVEIISSSPILKNPPFGFLNQDYFFNAILVLKTSMGAMDFLKYILHIEQALGRVRLFKNSPRVIDIDIIFFKNKKINKKNLIIPHNDWMNRLSVILPLSLS